MSARRSSVRPPPGCRARRRAARPAAAGMTCETSGRAARSFRARDRLRASRRSAGGHHPAGRGPRARRPRAGPAGRDGLRQDVHDGAGAGRREPAGARDGAQQDARRAVVSRSSAGSFRATRSSSSSATTTTTSRRRTCPLSDSYIEKEAIINDEIDRLRLSATRSLFERRDVIIVASVSCIYGLGSPEAYYGLIVVARAPAAHRPRPHAAEARRNPVRAQRP